MTSGADKRAFAGGDWWRRDGAFATLHAVNPLRLQWAARRIGGFAGKRLADVGCGGGIFSEAAADAGARVVGIDESAGALAAARKHGGGGGAEYRRISAEDLAAESPAAFDAVVCFETLEHLDDPRALVAACATLLAPGGDLLISTINRSPAAYWRMIVVLECALNLLPRGLHDYRRFVTPAETASFCRDAGLRVTAIDALEYDFFGRHFYFTAKRSPVNYFLHARRER